MKIVECNGLALPSDALLEKNFHLKYGAANKLGWGPRMRWKFGHYNPDDYYESLVDSLLEEGQSWLDIGSGRNLFPSNPGLSRILAARAGYLIGVDPDETLDDNPYVHDRAKVMMDDFETDVKFDLLTMRMVAEHVVYPDRLLSSIERCTKTGSIVVVYTINRWSPVPIVTHILPFSLHNPIKKVFWGTEQKDTFPTAYKMNTYQKLTDVFTKHDFTTAYFSYLDDCRTLAKYRSLLYMELSIQKLTKKLGVVYPENCLLAAFRKK